MQGDGETATSVMVARCAALRGRARLQMAWPAWASRHDSGMIGQSFREGGTLDRGLQRLRHFARDVVLHHQEVIEGPVVGLRPHDVAVLGANQPRRNSKSVAGFPHTSVQHVRDREGHGRLRFQLQIPVSC